MVRMGFQILRLIASAGIPAGVAAVASPLPHVDRVTVAILLLLSVFVIATRWGLKEAVLSALVGTALLDYFILPPYGFGIESFGDWVSLIVFLSVAITTSFLSTQAKQKTIETLEHRRELEKLYSFGNAILQGGSFEDTVGRGLDQICKIFGVEGTTFHDQGSDKIFRAGKKSEAVLDENLRQASREKAPFVDEASAVAIVPVGFGGKPIGSLGISGSRMPERMHQAVAQRFGIAIGKARVIEESVETEAIRKSQELKSVILDALAHEVKTPLTTIKVGVTSLLSRNQELSPSAIELLTLVDEETAHLDRSITNALQMARIDAGDLILEKGLHEIRHLIDSSLRELAGVLKGRPVEIRLAEDLPGALFDFRLLTLVFKELLVNAQKYSPAGSPLVISGQLSNGDVVISVADSGVGVELDEQYRIFDRYYRVSDKQHGISGTGLGLAISKSIIEAHGGEIRVTSQSGGGSVFSFSLPLQRETVA